MGICLGPLLFQPFVSCIPTGVYRLKRDNFRGRYDNFKIVDNDLSGGRYGIEFHRGVDISHTSGCILVGDKAVIDELVPSYRITSSREAMKEFMGRMDGVDRAVLIISDARTGMF